MTTTLSDAPKTIAGGFGRSAPLIGDQIVVLPLEEPSRYGATVNVSFELLKPPQETETP